MCKYYDDTIMKTHDEHQSLNQDYTDVESKEIFSIFDIQIWWGGGE